MLNLQYYSYIEGTLYCLTAVTTNISILCLYRRIFVTEPFRRISLIMIFVNILWFIPGTLVEIFICVPIKSAWDTSEDGKCIRYGTFWMVIMAVELLIDVTILILSIREISTLKMIWKQKLVVVMMFMSGGLSVQPCPGFRYILTVVVLSSLGLCVYHYLTIPLHQR